MVLSSWTTSHVPGCLPHGKEKIFPIGVESQDRTKQGVWKHNHNGPMKLIPKTFLRCHIKKTNPWLPFMWRIGVSHLLLWMLEFFWQVLFRSIWGHKMHGSQSNKCTYIVSIWSQESHLPLTLESLLVSLPQNITRISSKLSLSILCRLINILLYIWKIMTAVFTFIATSCFSPLSSVRDCPAYWPHSSPHVNTVVSLHLLPLECSFVTLRF